MSNRWQCTIAFRRPRLQGQGPAGNGEEKMIGGGENQPKEEGGTKRTAIESEGS